MRIQTYRDKAWPVLDYARWAFAFCVVMIHVISLYRWEAPAALRFIIYPSVPFFFMCSGFLLGHKASGKAMGKEREMAILSYGGRILRMFVYWIAIYLPLAIGSFWFAPVEDAGIGKFLFAQARSIFMMGEVRFSWPTWYLYSLAIAAYALFLQEKFRFSKILIIAGGAFGVLALHIGECYRDELGSTIFNLILSVKNMTAGMLYATIGYIFAYVGRGRQCLIASVILLALGMVFFALHFPYWEGLAAFGCFLASIQRISTRRSAIGEYARRQSMWVYLLHMYVITMLYYFTLASELVPWEFWGAGCMLSILLSSLAIWAQKGDGVVGRFLRRLT
ncbi:MAG: acyltransferase [Clostridium sp.]|nr:acyltransferase [Clostridium sp.]